MQEVRLLASLPPHVFPFAAGKVLIRNQKSSKNKKGVLITDTFLLTTFSPWIKIKRLRTHSSGRTGAVDGLMEGDADLVIKDQIDKDDWKLFIDGLTEGHEDLVIKRNEEIERWMWSWMVIIAIKYPTLTSFQTSLRLTLPLRQIWTMAQ